MRSRGINAEAARDMLSCGFAGDEAGRVPDPAVRVYLMDYLYNRLQSRK